MATLNFDEKAQAHLQNVLNFLGKKDEELPKSVIVANAYLVKYVPLFWESIDDQKTWNKIVDKGL